MTEPYWEPTFGSELIPELISHEIVKAFEELMEDGDLYINVKKGKLNARFSSLNMPEKEGELIETWHKDFDLLEVLLEEAEVLEDEEGAGKIEEMAKLLDNLAVEFRKKAGLTKQL